MAKGAYIGGSNGYRVLEYIEATGTQYIDTGIILDLRKDLKIECQAGWTVSERGMLLYGFSGEYNLSIELYSDTVLRVYNRGEIIPIGSLTFGKLRELASISVDYTATTGELVAELETQAKSGVLGEPKRVLHTQNARLGANASGGNAYGMFGPMKIYNPNLVRDFVPCIKAAGEIGMYDKVNDVFYTNAGSGTFIAGAETGEVVGPDVANEVQGVYLGIDNFAKRQLPSGYTQVEYIESTGTQYIDTGLVLNQNSKLELEMSHFDTGIQRMVFGSRKSATEQNFSIISGNSNNIVADFYNYNYNRLSYIVNSDEPLEMSISKAKLKINGSEKAVSTYSPFTTPGTAYLFNGNGSYPTGYTAAIMRLYYCRIYDNNRLVRDFVPAINPDGVAGLYDTVNQRFYANAGSGAFEVGEVYASTAHTVRRSYFGDENGIAQVWYSLNPYFIPADASRLITADGKIFECKE